MQIFTTSPEKTHGVSRPDPTGKARTPAASDRAESTGAAFGKIYQASASRSDQVARTGASDGREARANATQSEARDGKDQTVGATADRPDGPQDPAAAADGTQDATSDAGTTRAADLTESDAAVPGTLPDGDPADDATRPGTQAKTVSDADGSTRSEGAGSSGPGQAVVHGRRNEAGASAARAGKASSHEAIAPDAAHASGAASPARLPERPPADLAAQSLVGSASTKPGAAHGAAQPESPDPMRRAEALRKGRWGELAASRGPMSRGPEDARSSAPIPANALANTMAAPVIAGDAASALSTRGLSALSTGSAGGDGKERWGDLDIPPGAEPRGTSGSTPGSAALAALPRSDLPQSIAMQITAAIQKGGSGMKPGIELRLSPEELGAVRLTFTQSETGVTVNVQAERSETLELLRRNISLLAQEFLDIGYDSAEFTFGDGDRDAPGAARTGAIAGPETGGEAAPEAPRAINPTLLMSDRLDIRL